MNWKMQILGRFRLAWRIGLASMLVLCSVRWVFGQVDALRDPDSYWILRSENTRLPTGEVLFTPGEPHQLIGSVDGAAINVWAAITTFWPEAVGVLLFVPGPALYFIYVRRKRRNRTKQYCRRCRYEMPDPPAPIPATCSECGADLTQARALCCGERMWVAAMFPAAGLVLAAVLYGALLRHQSRVVPFNDAFDWPSLELYRYALRKQWNGRYLCTGSYPFVREVDLCTGNITRLYGPFAYRVALVELDAQAGRLDIYESVSRMSRTLRLHESIPLRAQPVSTPPQHAPIDAGQPSTSAAEARDRVFRALEVRGVALQHGRDSITAAIVTADGTRVYYGTEESEMVLTLELEDGSSRPEEIEGSSMGACRVLVMSPDERLLLAMCPGRPQVALPFFWNGTWNAPGSVLVIDTQSANVVLAEPFPTASVETSPSPSPDGAYLVFPMLGATGYCVLDLNTIAQHAGSSWSLGE